MRRETHFPRSDSCVPRRHKRPSAPPIHQRVVDGIAEERTFSFDARAVVPTTEGFTSATPSAGSITQLSPAPPAARRCAPAQAMALPANPAGNRPGENEVRQGKRAPESQPVGNRSSKNRQKPHQPAEQAGKIRGPLQRKAQRFVQIPRQRGKRRVIGEPLKQLADIGHPERPLKPVRTSSLSRCISSCSSVVRKAGMIADSGPWHSSSALFRQSRRKQTHKRLHVDFKRCLRRRGLEFGVALNSERHLQRTERRRFISARVAHHPADARP